MTIPRVMSEILSSLDGLELSGGCEHCSAYQRIIKVSQGIHILRIFHDSECPFYQGIKSKDGTSNGTTL